MSQPEISERDKFLDKINREIAKEEAAAAPSMPGAEQASAASANVVDLKKTEISQPGRSAAQEIVPKVRAYRKFVYLFFFLVAVLLGAAAYFAFVKVKVIVVPKEDTISNNLIIDIADPAGGGSASGTAANASGTVALEEIASEESYPATGEKIMKEDMQGKVRIVNNYIKNQQLVATTRLLTPDQKLFRIKETVNVPAGGSVDVEIYPDKPGTELGESDIRFTIPGLWAGLQDKIYAESSGKILSEKETVKFIQESDIASATEAIKNVLDAEAKKAIDAKYSQFDVVLISMDQDSYDARTAVAADDEAGSFTMKASAGYKVVAFKRDAAMAVINEKLKSSIPQTKELMPIDPASVKFGVNDANPAMKTAAVSATFDVRMELKAGTDIVDRSLLVGLSKAQMEEFLRQQADIESFELVFTPSFIKRAPRLVDRITIEVKQ